MRSLLWALAMPAASALSLGASRLCGAPPESFPAFVERHGRSYTVGTPEYSEREALFEERVGQVARHNCDPVGPWTASVNHLADWRPSELAALLGHRPNRAERGRRASARESLLDLVDDEADEHFPGEFSWGNLAAIQESAGEQGDCGSCWAFASQLAMHSRAEVAGVVSNQSGWSTAQLIACTPNPHHCGGDGGCAGATAELAYEYVLNMGLLSVEGFREESKTYLRHQCPPKWKPNSEEATRAAHEADGSEAHRVSEAKVGGLIGWNKLPENKEHAILRELMTRGPLSVAVAAGDGWFGYSQGVLTAESCDRNLIINHAVVLFGWGVKQKTVIGPVKYWQLKNSWGPSWGEHGTGRIIRSDDEEKACGWDAAPEQGSGCAGGPSRVWVCGTCGILYDVVAPIF